MSYTFDSKGIRGTEEDRMRQTPTRERDLDCGSNSCRFGGLGKGGMRTNGRCQCVQHLIDRVNSHAALVEALEMLLHEPMSERAVDKAKRALKQAKGGV